MDHSDPAAALGAVVHCRLVQTLTLNIILKNTTPLHRCIQADAHDAATEEEEDEKPLHASPARALPLHFCKSEMAAMLASYFHRSASGSFDFLGGLDNLKGFFLVNRVVFV
jgi:hypothetical protein